MELLVWYPNLTTKDESSVKKQFKSIIGEWHNAVNYEAIRNFLIARGGVSDECDKSKALATRRRL